MILKARRFLSRHGALVALAAIALFACQREPNPHEGLSESDRKKLQALFEKSLKKPELTDLPAKYHARQQPDFAAGEVFHIYIDGEFLRAVKAGDYSCEAAEEKSHLKGRKVVESCPLFPFLLKQAAGKKIQWLELAGESWGHKAYDLAAYEKEGAEVVAFVNRQGKLKVEDRLARSFLSEEEEGKDGRELRKEGKGKGSGKRGGMRGRFKLRGLYWADLYTTAPPPEAFAPPASEGEAPAETTPAPAQAEAPEGKALSLAMPGGETKWLSLKDLEACGEKGCSLRSLLPDSFSGTWCVTTSQGVVRVPAAELRERAIKTRRQGGGAVITKSLSGGDPIRSPSAIAPCE